MGIKMKTFLELFKHAYLCSPLSSPILYPIIPLSSESILVFWAWFCFLNKWKQRWLPWKHTNHSASNSIFLMFCWALMAAATQVNKKTLFWYCLKIRFLKRLGGVQWNGKKKGFLCCVLILISLGKDRLFLQWAFLSYRSSSVFKKMYEKFSSDTREDTFQQTVSVVAAWGRGRFT